MQGSIRSASSPVRRLSLTWKRATPNQPGFSTVSVKCAQNWRGSACGSPNSPDAIFQKHPQSFIVSGIYRQKRTKNAPAARNLFSMADAFFSMESTGFQPIMFPRHRPMPGCSTAAFSASVRHQLRHKLMKRRGMIRLDKMAELMYCNIFHTRRRRLPELSGKSHDLLFSADSFPIGTPYCAL